MLFYEVLQLSLQVITGMAVLYVLIFAVTGQFYRGKQAGAKPSCIRKIAVLIPGYKEDEVIVETVRVALQQEYPIGQFDVVIIADGFREETLEHLRRLPIKLVEVSFENSTKAKALNRAIERLSNIYDIAVVLDADNFMAADFLSRVNEAFDQGALALQGHRTAKNMDTPLAVLDAISEEINNHIFRKGHRAAGLSSAIIGSGMAFDYSQFKRNMANVNAIGGFDKELELILLRNGTRIEYLESALVYDEKVREPDNFTRQRRRWLSAQIHYLKVGFPDSFHQLLRKGNIDYFDKVIQFIQPPRVILLGFVGLACIAFPLLNAQLGVAFHYSVAWWILWAFLMLALCISVPRRFYRLNTMMVLMRLPAVAFYMMRSFVGIRGANKRFIHTSHHSKTMKKDI
jgi:cellulose synthase/poly-beta-1,6-N-acetylglucosamine synthase-like glycosyltransferase